jgi:hypothetical protein
MFRTVSLAVLLILLPVSAAASTIYVDPQGGTYGRGDTFIALVRIDNEKDCINAAHVEVDYPAQILRAVDFGKGDSIFSLWAEEPVINTEKGIVTFSGGIPGGYCGRIPGDPVLSNVLGKIVFTVTDASQSTADIRIASSSVVYLNDGAATKAILKTAGAHYDIVATPQLSENPWLTSIKDDTSPPDAFDITIESTRGVFGGKYYAVFATVDKQSGIDHYEVLERGIWRRVQSPYELKDQYLHDAIQIKAIDKAGNERMGTYTPGSAPPRVSDPREYILAIIVVALLLGLGALMWYRDRKRTRV